MISIKKFVFSPFSENTYLLYDGTGECIIIDPGCYDQHEENTFVDFINSKNLKPVKQVFTHCHIDHIFGINYIYEKYGLKPEIHKKALPFLINAPQHAAMFGFEIPKLVEPESFINEGDKVKFGNSELDVVYTPGHADGSICFINQSQKFVLTGDVLFRESIGRTDFPTGDFDVLMESIRTKLFTLDDEFIVYSGHGEETSIGYEKLNNPFIRL
jgi:glyoxylase-like metal-dependent hydrolase (beta-lactamase superfamily II)